MIFMEKGDLYISVITKRFKNRLIDLMSKMFSIDQI